MTTALIYVRQSRSKSYEHSVSPEVQENACRALPAVKACGQVEVFMDLDVSGGKRARRGYDAMLTRIRAGGVDVVAAYDQSRAFRSVLTAAEFKALLEEPAHRSVRVAFVHGSFDRSPVGGFSYAVLAAAHQLEREMTGKKIGEAYRLMNARGEATGMPPYGYRREGEGLVVDEHEASIVRRLFDEYATGNTSSRRLAAELNAEGLTKPRSRTGGLGWVPDTIADLLQNLAYVGKTYSVSRARREGEIIEASWSAIVERSLFDRVQRVLAANRVTGHGGAKHGTAHSYSFAGLLHCEACGRPMRATTDHGGAYYHCRRDVAADRKCDGARRGTREGRLMPWATALFERIDALRPADFDKALAAARRSEANPDAIAQVDRSLERQKKLFVWGHITEADYLREADRLGELREQLMGAAPVARSLQLKGILDAWKRGTDDARRQLLATLFDRLVVRDGEIVEYVPRVDRAAEVVALVDEAIGPTRQVLVPAEFGWRARGRPRVGAADKRGKGGIPSVACQYRARIA